MSAAVVAALVVLAGCAGTAPESGDDSGAVAFYVSDERNAIEDFEHLNVTITEVGFGVKDAANNSSEGWVTHDVDSVTVDLTELRGKNASQLGNFSVPAKEYTKVHMEVSAVEGTLKSGEEVDVKLPSDRLRVPKGLTVTSGGVEDFVFDISVFEAGQSGKYILKPVVGESGTDVPIEPVRKGGKGKSDDKGKSGDAASAAGSASMDFYLSDEQNAIEDFEHLNVTVTEVGLHRVDESGGGSWVTHEVDGRTVDLTRYQGANATRIGNFSVANGTYDKVFVYVSDVEGTLTNGEEVRVKLPSEKLHVNTRFEADANASIDYVFDISVFEAGQSGKYILKPVISESGTDVSIESTDDDAESEGRDEAKDDEKEERKDERAVGSLNASFESNVTPGENATLTVTRNGDPVANATVFVEGERAGATDDAGQYTVSVPENASELTVRVKADGAETELEFESESESRSGESSDANGGNGTASLRRPAV